MYKKCMGTSLSIKAPAKEIKINCCSSVICAVIRRCKPVGGALRVGGTERRPVGCVVGGKWRKLEDRS